MVQVEFFHLLGEEGHVHPGRPLLIAAHRQDVRGGVDPLDLRLGQPKRDQWITGSAAECESGFAEPPDERKILLRISGRTAQRLVQLRNRAGVEVSSVHGTSVRIP